MVIMEAKHTPGPLLLGKNDIKESESGLRSGAIYLDSRGARPWGQFVAIYRHHINNSDEETQANASLIAAAHDMLEALIWAKEQFKILSDKGLYPEHLLTENGGNGIMPIVQAINKATQP